MALALSLAATISLIFFVIVADILNGIFPVFHLGEAIRGTIAEDGQLMARLPENLHIGLGSMLLIAFAVVILGVGVLGYVLLRTTSPLAQPNFALERENTALSRRVTQLEDALSTARVLEISSYHQAIATRHQHETDMDALAKVIADMSVELAMYKELYEQDATAHVQIMNVYGNALFNLGNRLVAEAITADADRRSLQLIIADLSEKLARARMLNGWASYDCRQLGDIAATLSQELAAARAEIASLHGRMRFDYLTTIIVRRGGQEFMAHVPSFYSRHAMDSASHVLMRVCRIFGLPNNRYLASRMVKRLTINGENVTDGPCLAHIEPGDLVVVEFND